MATEHSKGGNRDVSAGFRISNGPVVRSTKGEGLPSLPEFGELPRFYGDPILFAIPRDPRTIFTYWNIDWSDVFARDMPPDRLVHLRVKRSDGSDETEQPIEPMLGSHYALVAQPRGVYQVELGFYQPAGAWNSVAISESVTMPPESASENAEVDVATVPFHLSFQRMIDMFRASNGNAIASILSRLQERATVQDDAHLLSAEEQEILRAMNLSVSELDAARRAFADQNRDDLLRKRAEAILGFGSTSPSGGLGGSSWGSASA